jgi:segregation and condensation protein B
LLFVSKEALTTDRIKKILDDADTKEIQTALDMLSKEYEARKGSFFLREAGGGYQLVTRPEYKEWIKRMIQPSPVRLTRAAMETLAIIAYKQPVIRSDIERIRRVDSGGILRMLLERRLIRVLGRKEIAGRPLIYATTRHFLEIFDLKNLNDLPSLKEIEVSGPQLAEHMVQQPLTMPEDTLETKDENQIFESQEIQNIPAPSYQEEIDSIDAQIKKLSHSLAEYMEHQQGGQVSEKPDGEEQEKTDDDESSNQEP